MRRLLPLGFAASALLFAQAPSFRARIPFAFAAAGRTFEAGEYSIESDVIPGLLVLKSGRGTIMIKGLPITSKAGHATVVFNRYGDRYFLSEVWPPGSASGRQVPATNQERGLARLCPPEHASVNVR